MSNEELKAQFERCQEWQDAEQWDLLAVAYYGRGYMLNALHCFRQANACRRAVQGRNGGSDARCKTT